MVWWFISNVYLIYSDFIVMFCNVNKNDVRVRIRVGVKIVEIWDKLV